MRYNIGTKYTRQQLIIDKVNLVPNKKNVFIIELLLHSQTPLENTHSYSRSLYCRFLLSLYIYKKINGSM